MQEQEQSVEHNGRIYQIVRTPITGTHDFRCELAGSVRCFQLATVLIQVGGSLLGNFACQHHIAQVQAALIERASVETLAPNLQRGTIIDVSTCARCGAMERIIHTIETYPGIEVWECANGHQHEVTMPRE